MNLLSKTASLSPTIVASVLCVYFLMLIAIAYFTSRKADTDSFFTGNRQSPWYLVAFGMIGASLSGVTFVSVPGKVISEGMAYFQLVIGYFFGYLVIAKLLLPLYYKLNVISIYEYLNIRLGKVAYKTGASIFIIARSLGSAIRLYLATEILHHFLFQPLGVNFFLTAIISIVLIWIYTFKGGIKTIVYTDTFQTLFLISAVIVCTIVICQSLGVDFSELYNQIASSKTTANFSMARVFHFDDPNSNLYFFKQFFAGMFLAIAMTGLDQDLMQKNLTCKNLKDAQKNMYSFTVVLIITNFLFLLLGGALYLYATKYNIALPTDQLGNIKTDDTFPFLAFNNFGTIAGVFFLLGITASSYASADSALAALTTGFCIDFLNFHKREEKEKKRFKLIVHIGFSLLFLLIILATKYYKTNYKEFDLIGLILKFAGYTYGPLLGLFAFGIFVKKRILKPAMIPFICILAPITSYYLGIWIQEITGGTYINGKLKGGFITGHEMIIYIGLIAFIGLMAISKKSTNQDGLHSKA